jgi:hypothetical protein
MHSYTKHITSFADLSNRCYRRHST